MDETKRRLYVEPDGFCTEAAILFMALAVVFRMIGSIGRWDDMHYLITQVALPVFSGLLMILCLLLFAKRAFWTTVIPVVCGVAFFIFRILEVENEWQMVGCIVLYVVIVVLYTMTFSHPKLKWLLALVLLAAFSFHVWQDLQSLLDVTREQPVGFLEGMQELSILGIMLSLLSLSLAMKMPKAAPAKAESPAPETAAEPYCDTAGGEPGGVGGCDQYRQPCRRRDRPAVSARPRFVSYRLRKAAARVRARVAGAGGDQDREVHPRTGGFPYSGCGVQVCV